MKDEYYFEVMIVGILVGAVAGIHLATWIFEFWLFQVLAFWVVVAIITVIFLMLYAMWRESRDMKARAAKDALSYRSGDDHAGE